MEKLRYAKRKIKYFLPPASRETRASSHFSSTLPPFLLLLLLLFLSSSSSSLPLSCNGATDHKIAARVKMERVFRALPRSEQGVSLKPSKKSFVLFPKFTKFFLFLGGPCFTDFVPVRSTKYEMRSHLRFPKAEE